MATIRPQAWFTLGWLAKIVLCECDNGFSDNFIGGHGSPPYQRREACGYDPSCYIATAGLAVVPYTTQAAIVARSGGLLQTVIPATDDDSTGNINQPIFDGILANITEEINGFISSIYPIPLAKTGTIAILKVTAVSSDGLGTITGIKMLQNGGYAVAPALTNSPAYLRFKDIRDYDNCWGWNWDWNCQNGTGASLTVTFTTPTTVTPQTPIVVAGTPVIAAGGLGYQVNELLVLTGGSSFVPDKITNAATTLFCFDLLRRRLNPQENNLFWPDAKKSKEELEEIANGEKVLDGTYRTFFSPVTAIVQQSVLLGNSL